MARFSVSGRATVIGTNVRAVASLYATTGVRPRVEEVHVSNTTATAVCVGVARLTAIGTQGTGLTEVPEESPDHVAVATAFAGHTADATVSGELRRTMLGAAAGSSYVWTFEGIEIPALTTAGLGIIIPTGTGQILDYAIVWRE